MAFSGCALQCFFQLVKEIGEVPLNMARYIYLPIRKTVDFFQRNPFPIESPQDSSSAFSTEIKSHKFGWTHGVLALDPEKIYSKFHFF